MVDMPAGLLTKRPRCIQSSLTDRDAGAIDALQLQLQGISLPVIDVRAVLRPGVALYGAHQVA